MLWRVRCGQFPAQLVMSVLRQRIRLKVIADHSTTHSTFRSRTGSCPARAMSESAFVRSAVARTVL